MQLVYYLNLWLISMYSQPHLNMMFFMVLVIVLFYIKTGVEKRPIVNVLLIN